MELENALVDSQKRLTNVETTNEVLRKELDNQQAEIEKIQSETKHWLDLFFKGIDILNTMNESQKKQYLEYLQKLREEDELKDKIEQSKPKSEQQES